MSEQGTTRSFLACWPDRAVRGQLKAWADRFASQAHGRAISLDNIHMTLAFLGDLTPAQIDLARRCCQPLPRVFRLNLDHIGYWKRKGIIWVGTKHSDAELIQFVEGLRQGLKQAGLRLESRPFVPHVTLTRKSRRIPGLEFEPVPWLIGTYSLVASELTQEGSRYSVSNRWSTLGDVK